MKKLLFVLVFGLFVAACATQPSPPPPEKVVTQVVEKQVTTVVEKQVTTVVEKQVLVTPTTQPPAPVAQEATYALKGDPVTMDPRKLTNASAEGFLELFYEPLVKVDESTNEVVPSLAESWSWVDPTTLQFKLKQGIKHTSGNEFTADDVKWTLETTIDPELGLYKRVVLSEIQSVEVVDKYTANIHTSAPSRALVRNLTYVANMVDSKWAKEHDDAYLVTHASGTGPYKLVEYVPGQYAIAERRSDYWNPNREIYLNKITLRVIPEDGARVAALLSGEFQAIERVPVEMVPVISNTVGFKMIDIPSVRPIFVAFRVTKPPFDDLKMRQAAMYALDFNLINNTVYNGFGKVLATVNHPEVPCTLTSLQPWPYDPDKAKQLLAEAGYTEGKGPEITLLGPNGRYLKDKEFTEAVADQLQAVGFQVKIQLVEVGVYFKQSATVAADAPDNIFVASWANNPREPDFTFSPNWGYTEGTSLFETGYRNPKTVELAKLGKETLDTKEACKDYEDLQKIIYDDMPWGPKFIYTPDLIGTTDTIDGVQVRANETWSLIGARIVK
ncbi:MAG: ABC transporter substrate-binding protein [Ardenticatenaceae bacterium]|nr:ABC transporter substrate-binding protein [Ardenticatenaceae bacterium]HBY95156.1 hypothetical protein [Chloroflexota bacterium]